MAKPPTVVLPFPAVPSTERPTLHPGLLADWQVLHLHFTHELLRIARLGSLMSAAEILALQGEWSLLARRLDAIEAAIKSRVMDSAKKVGLIA